MNNKIDSNKIIEDKIAKMTNAMSDATDKTTEAIDVTAEYKGLSVKIDKSLANGFTIIPDIFIIRYGDPKMATVWGRMYRYSLMREGVCRASIAKLAKGTGWSKRTIIRTIKNLEDLGYVTDTTPNLRNRPHIYIVNLAKVNRETRDHFGNKNYAKE